MLAAQGGINAALGEEHFWYLPLPHVNVVTRQYDQGRLEMAHVRYSQRLRLARRPGI